MSILSISDWKVEGLPVYLRIRREGSRISLMRSADGVSYEEAGSKDVGTATDQVALGDDVLVGFAVTGGGAGRTAAEFRGIALEGTPGGGPRFRRGDVDSSGKLDISDAVQVLGYLFLGTPGVGCLEAADANDDGKVNLTDAIAILGYLFQGGASPAPPGPDACGVDTTPPDLGCEKAGP